MKLFNHAALYLQYHAASHPDRIAVSFNGKHITYAQLDLYSTYVARRIKERGILPGSAVPICLDRSFEMIIGIWGILKARCGYVPIDTKYPAERIQFIIDDTGATLIVTDKASTHVLNGVKKEFVLCIDMAEIQTANDLSTDVLIDALDTDIAYVLYTSGSTGQPKGVVMHHAPVVNRIAWECRYFNLTPDDSILQKTTYCFDVSVSEIMAPVFVGARLVLAMPGYETNNEYLIHIIEKEAITTCHFAPSLLSMFLEDIHPGYYVSLKRILSSGEALKPVQVYTQRDKLPHVHLFNMYGPTETAIEVTCYNTSDLPGNASSVPIGKPIDNIEIVIVDDELNILEQGKEGELLIGGAAVAKGYLNRPDLTNEKFITLNMPNGTAARFYRSGDIARYLPDGNIEFIGRVDDQVKIMGIRIELLEIENVIESHEAVNRAVVLAKETNHGISRLICYLSVKNTIDTPALIAYTQSKLPDYSIPSQWIFLEKIPLNASGKVNKKALPEISQARINNTHFEDAATDTEKLLAKHWQELFQVEEISVTDHFLSVGGYSLVAQKMAVIFSNLFNVELNAKHIYTYPTIRELADYIDKNTVSLTENSSTSLGKSFIGFFRRSKK